MTRAHGMPILCCAAARDPGICRTIPSTSICMGKNVIKYLCCFGGRSFSRLSRPHKQLRSGMHVLFSRTPTCSASVGRQGATHGRRQPFRSFTSAQRPVLAVRERAGAAKAMAQQQIGAPAVFHYTQIELQSKPGIQLIDITPQVATHTHAPLWRWFEGCMCSLCTRTACLIAAPVLQIRAEVERLGVQEGFVNILSRHTTTAITINECEPRLLDDVRQVCTFTAQEGQGALLHDWDICAGSLGSSSSCAGLFCPPARCACRAPWPAGASSEAKRRPKRIQTTPFAAASPGWKAPAGKKSTVPNGSKPLHLHSTLSTHAIVFFLHSSCTSWRRRASPTCTMTCTSGRRPQTGRAAGRPGASYVCCKVAWQGVTVAGACDYPRVAGRSRACSVHSMAAAVKLNGGGCLPPAAEAARPPPPRMCRAAQEPENAHSHLLSMLLGNSETVPVTKGKLALGTWQVGGRVGGCCFMGRAGGVRHQHLNTLQVAMAYVRGVARLRC